jgi:hypothetical protein
MKILPSYWNDKPVYRAKKTKDFAYKNFNTRLDNIQNAAVDTYRGLLNKNMKVNLKLNTLNF